MSETRAKKVLIHVALPVLLAVVSIFLLSSWVPNWSVIENTKQSIEESNETALEFVGVATTASLAISALPGDFATPIAENFADINKYLIIVLVAVFAEKLILVGGIKVAFTILIPVACVLWALGHLVDQKFIVDLGIKVGILSVVLVLLIPVSVNLTKFVGQEYLTYVEETIEETGNGVEVIQETTTENGEDTGLLDRLTTAFETLTQDAVNVKEYLQGTLKRSINSVVILLVTNMVMPVLTLMVFWGIIKGIFGVALPKLEKPATEKSE